MIASPFGETKAGRALLLRRLHGPIAPFRHSREHITLLLGIRQVGLSLLVGPARDTLLPIILYVEG
jgi:hypothetical protein